MTVGDWMYEKEQKSLGNSKMKYGHSANRADQSEPAISLSPPVFAGESLLPKVTLLNPLSDSKI